jgi:phosphopantetheine adenylyltransferase
MNPFALVGYRVEARFQEVVVVLQKSTAKKIQNINFKQKYACLDKCFAICNEKKKISCSQNTRLCTTWWRRSSNKAIVSTARTNDWWRKGNK